MLVNGVFPGPLIEANWGDTIQVTVHNRITGPEEGTALHWHGLLQKTSQWFDGVPGVQQCPIPPGGTFTYTFVADLYGTSWWHSHYSAQYNAGILGPMIIHGPQTLPYDIGEYTMASLTTVKITLISSRRGTNSFDRLVSSRLFLTRWRCRLDRYQQGCKWILRLPTHRTMLTRY